MGMKCLMNGLEVNYPCSPACALFGDCVTAFEANKKASVRTNADRIRAMTDEELAEFLYEARFSCQMDCKKCLRGPDCTPISYWLQQQQNIFVTPRK